MLTSLLALLLAFAAQPADITFDTILAIPPASPALRAPFRPDPIQAAIAQRRWTTPTDGAVFGGATWTPIRAGADGAFTGRPLSGGYAYATFDSPADRIMLLEAAGHGMLYFNGVPRAGDPYDYGFLKLPVRIKAGRNDILIQSGRGRLSLKLTEPASPLLIDLADATLPDLVEGTADPAIAGIVIINATDSWQRDLTASAACEGATSSTRLPAIPPLTIRKVPIPLSPPTNARAAAGEVAYHIAISNDKSQVLTQADVKLRVRTAAQTRKVTFISDIDGSVQYYCINPHTPAPDETPHALVLSLHGASVQATNQADAYRAKPWCDIVCPTNRRPFGFDWEDWGRADAIEVLDHATNALKPDPQRIYLTGHSMGGHGTWSIGALNSPRFAAIAPSAGWISFWSYAGAQDYTNPSPIETIFRRAMSPSDTLKFARNYAMTGVYILHGDADDNVPVAQAREMRRNLAEFHPDFAYHEQPGAGHWWGNECVDWDPLFYFLKSHTRPTDADTTHIEFTTPNVGVSSQCHWASIQQSIIQNDPASIDLNLDRESHTLRGDTTNVARLRLDPRTFNASSLTIKFDGGNLETPLNPAAPLDLELAQNGWVIAANPSTPDTAKNPLRTGPFKHAFSHRALLIYATGGSDADRAWAFNKARFDAESFYYRGNGTFDIIPDTDFNPDLFKDRSIVIYGNADTNKAWKSLLASSPIQVSAGHARMGEKDFSGNDIVALFLRPREGSATALVGVVAPTGPTAQHAADRIAYFSSGIAYPDWTIFSAEVLSDGLAGVLGAGFFDNNWQIDPSQAAVPGPR